MVWYLACPVAGDAPSNLARAARWLRWLRERSHNAVIIAPWLAPLLAGTERDDNPEDRARGIRDCIEVVPRCDGIVLCGGRITAGMRLELKAAREHDLVVADLTSISSDPPEAWWNAEPPLEWGRAQSRIMKDVP